jgi:primosomal protein N'
MMGCLDEGSIWKCLHSNLRSKTESKEAVAASCIGSALTEFFLHGEAVYEKRRQQLALVAERSNITHAVVGLNQSFDDRVSDWKKKYGK